MELGRDGRVLVGNVLDRGPNLATRHPCLVHFDDSQALNVKCATHEIRGCIVLLALSRGAINGPGLALDFLFDESPQNCPAVAGESTGTP
jgi:hypothetical protein